MCVRPHTSYKYYFVSNYSIKLIYHGLIQLSVFTVNPQATRSTRPRFATQAPLRVRAVGIALCLLNDIDMTVLIYGGNDVTEWTKDIVRLRLTQVSASLNAAQQYRRILYLSLR